MHLHTVLLISVHFAWHLLKLVHLRALFLVFLLQLIKSSRFIKIKTRFLRYPCRKQSGVVKSEGRARYGLFEFYEIIRLPKICLRSSIVALVLCDVTLSRWNYICGMFCRVEVEKCWSMCLYRSRVTVLALPSSSSKNNGAMIP